MQRFFLLNIIFLTFCVCDTDIASHNSYRFYDHIKVELLEDQYVYSTSDVYKIGLSAEEVIVKDNSRICTSEVCDVREILKIQNATFQEIRLALQLCFITSHHANSYPNLLS